MMKKKITYKDLRAMGPCYHPSRIGIKSDYSATIPEFIKEYRDKVNDKEDILWVMCRKEYMTERDMRLFAVWCAREALKLVAKPDYRSVEACNVAEKFANEKATTEELAAASAAARTAASAAASAASRTASSAAVSAAAWTAASAAASGVVWAAVWGVVWDAVWDAQIDKLATYFK